MLLPETGIIRQKIIGGLSNIRKSQGPSAQNGKRCFVPKAIIIIFLKDVTGETTTNEGLKGLHVS